MITHSKEYRISYLRLDFCAFKWKLKQSLNRITHVMIQMEVIIR